MDQKLFLLLSGLSGQSVWLDKLIYFCAVSLPWVTVLALAVWILLQKRWSERIKGVLVFFFAGLAWWLASFFKYAYFSPRPFMELFQDKPLFTTNIWWDSLPSGHAVLFGALVGASFILKNKTMSLILLISAMIIALARVIAGVHWPSDVVVGLIFGSFFGFALAKIFIRAFHLN